MEPERTPEEIKQEIQSLAKETKQTYEKILSEWAEIKILLDNLEKDPEFYSVKINKE